MQRPTRDRWLARLVGFALATHAMWFFGNLYEQLLLVPNGVVATAAQVAAYNAFFAVTQPIVFYVPVTQLGFVATAIAAWLARGRGPVARRLGLAALLSALGLGLTAWIVVRYNLRLWLGDVTRFTDADVQAMVVRWGAWNAARLLVVGVAAIALLRARDATLTAPTGAASVTDA